jgi:hypothetical protein
MSLLSYTNKSKLTAFNNFIQGLKRKGINSMSSLLKVFVLLAILLLASNANVFTSLSPVAGNQVQEIHFIQLQQPMSDPTNEPSCKPILKQTNDQTTNEVRPSSTSNTSYMFEAVTWRESRSQ